MDTEEDSVIMRSDNLPIVDLSKYHTDGQMAHYIQINNMVGKLTENKMDLKTLVSKTVIDSEMTTARASMRREKRDTAPEGYRPVFDNLSIQWGLVFVPKCRTHRFGKKTDQDITFWSFRHNKNAIRRKTFQVAGDAERYRAES